MMDSTQNISDIVREIKQSFNSYKNGVVAQSMRDKGVSYHVNWGVSITDLQHIASRYEADRALARSLWTNNVRECQIIALMLMPPEDITSEDVEAVMSRLHTTELAELAAFLLFQHVNQKANIALDNINSADTYRKLCAFHIILRAIRQGCNLTQEQRATIKWVSRQVLDDGDNAIFSLRKVAIACLQELSDDNF